MPSMIVLLLSCHQQPLLGLQFEQHQLQLIVRYTLALRLVRRTGHTTTVEMEEINGVRLGYQETLRYADRIQVVCQYCEFNTEA